MDARKIAEILVDSLSYVYCHSCDFNDGRYEDKCEMCHRKNMEWALSRKEAELIADRIVDSNVAKWVDTNMQDDSGKWLASCSRCHRTDTVYAPYCWNCGASMVEVEK